MYDRKMDNIMIYTCSVLRFKPAEPEELLKAFQLLDPENHGYIMKDDLEKSIMEIGEPFTKEEVADMMAVACDAETGKINYEHYINLLIVCKNIDLFLILLRFFSTGVYTLSERFVVLLNLSFEIFIQNIQIIGKNSRRH